MGGAAFCLQCSAGFWFDWVFVQWIWVWVAIDLIDVGCLVVWLFGCLNS
jgi:hypothetical protein